MANKSAFKIDKALSLKPQDTAPSSPSVGDLYNDEASGILTWDGSQWVPIIGSSSNKILYVSTAGGNVFTLTTNTSASSRPDNGFVSGATNLSVALNGSPLFKDDSFVLSKSANDAQGQQASIPFTLDPAYRAKVLNIKVPYKVASGIFTAGSRSADSDLIMYIAYQDPDDSVWKFIEPSSFKFLGNSSTISDVLEGTFQTHASAVNYRLIFHVATTSASAWSLSLDQISIEKSNYTYGTPATDIQTYTPVITGFGSASSIQGSWRRVGDCAEIQFNFTSGTPTAVPAKVSLPSGLVADTSKMPSGRIFGPAASTYSSATYFGIASMVDLSDPSNILIGLQSNAAGEFSAANGNALAGSGTKIGGTILVPILGWSSSVQMSDRTDTRVVAARYESTATTALASSAYTKIPTWGVKNVDTHSAMSGDTYTVPVSGLYEISGMVTLNSYAWTTGQLKYAAYKNGSFLGLIAKWAPTNSVSGAAASAACTQGELLADLKSGDLLTFHVWQSQTASGLALGGTETCVQIKRLSGPSAIAANETVAASYWLSASQTTSAQINFDSREFDTHGSVTTGVGAWKFTAPIEGLYSIIMSLNSNTYNITVYKNGVAYKQAGGGVSGAGQTTGTMIYLRAGDYIDFRPSASMTFGGGALSGGTTSNIAIVKVGN